MQHNKSEFFQRISICVLLLILGISCSDDKDDETGKPAISVSAGDISNITWNGFTIEGSITKEKYMVTEVGFCYSDENERPTLDDKIIPATYISDTEFSVTLTGLSPATTYYIGGFLKYPTDVVYSQVFTVKTANVPEPIVKTLEADIIPGIIGYYLVFSGEMIYDGPYEIVEKGFAYSLTPNPVIEDEFAITHPIQDHGEKFSASTYNWTLGNQYYIRAYIKDEKETIYYGNEVTFPTMD